MLGARRLVLALLVALAGCSYPHLIDDGKVDELYLERIQDNVARVTSLDVGPLVSYSVIREADARAKFARDLDRDLPEADAHELEKTLRAFGFVHGPLDLRKVFGDLLAEQAAAFYDPLEKKYFFIDRPAAGGFSTWLACWLTNRDIPNELTASHELVHALEDRVHDLDAWWREGGDDEDARLARQAVVEGDAMYFGFLAMGLHDIEITREDLLEEASGEALERAPRVLREMLIFPYWAGYRFAKAARESGRDPFAKPPRSTAEVLHGASPARRPRERLALGASKLGARWTLVKENTLGAFLTGVLLGGADTPGWVDDRFRVFEDSEGRVALSWALIFEKAEDASSFAARYRSVQRAKDVKEAAVEVAGRLVAIGEAPDNETFRVLRDAAWLAR